MPVGPGIRSLGGTGGKLVEELLPDEVEVVEVDGVEIEASFALRLSRLAIEKRIQRG